MLEARSLLDTTLGMFPGPSPASSVPGEGERAPTDVADRSTTFQPVEGGTEHRSGETLLVGAYAGLWALLLFWVLFQWTKQTALARRLDSLEAAIADAAKGAARGEATRSADPPS